MICSKCGSYSEDDARFCFRCGQALTAAAVEIEADMHLPEDVDVSEELSTIAAVELPPVLPTMPPVIHPVAEIPPSPAPTPADAPAPPAVSTPEPAAEVPAAPAQDVQPMPVSVPVVSPAPVPVPQRKGRLVVPVIILILLSVIGFVVYFLFPAPGYSADDTYGSAYDIDHPEFAIVSGELYYFDVSGELPEELTVPDTISGSPVVALGASCFEDMDGVASIILPATLRHIREQAFYDCSDLRGIYIPEGVQTIGSQAFANCSSLEAISLPASLNKIEGNAFSGCSKLKYIFFSGTVDQWKEIYQGRSGIKAKVTCSDGSCLME